MWFAFNAKGELRVHPSTHSIHAISNRETKEDPHSVIGMCSFVMNV